MSHSAVEMLCWNYKEMLEFFMPDGRIKEDYSVLNIATEYVGLVAQKRCAQVYDYTKNTQMGKQMLREVITSSRESTLIMIDGESGTGKTTFATKLCEKEGFFLFDIDEYATKLLVDHIFSGTELPIFLDAAQDMLLKTYTEEIIRRESDNGKKTVVMVGSFRNIIFRSIIAQTIGKFFKRTVSIVIHDKLEANLARVKERNNNVELSEAVSIVRTTHNDMETLHDSALPFYGVGFNASCWVNHAAVHDFEFN